MPVLTQNTQIEFHNYVQRKLRERFPDYATNFDPKRFKEFPNPRNFWAFIRDLDPNADVRHLSRRVGNLLTACMEHDVKVPVKINGVIHNLSDAGELGRIKRHVYDRIKKESRLKIMALTEGNNRRAVDTIRSWSAFRDDMDIVATMSYLLLFSCLNRRDSPIIFPSGQMSNSKKKEVEECLC